MEAILSGYPLTEQCQDVVAACLFHNAATQGNRHGRSKNDLPLPSGRLMAQDCQGSMPWGKRNGGFFSGKVWPRVPLAASPPHLLDLFSETRPVNQLEAFTTRMSVKPKEADPANYARHLT